MIRSRLKMAVTLPAMHIVRNPPDNETGWTNISGFGGTSLEVNHQSRDPGPAG